MIKKNELDGGMVITAISGDLKLRERKIILFHGETKMLIQP